ncbi:Formamidopyrimidine-DNA glycosylase N-terminal domain-containing protein [Cantharellus anzutake]|uniref:Formamidopyrimidine-DNA glycosylase N-terminal domain-containing protein n=1 Tax=Cantharellus anzutake TaxID=1750568 RepID=UPI001905A623|nr:Formamidopyrimidine-DNA glycosylase N-terminal domain-containing protein [Cantharellus anzutake]KAF8344000.1 Formamidopyrimidine-DNA glycosylase N-terminal domain-containing protein [Cantharellus anzutake]
MPELPEVHRIAGIVRRAALGRRIRAIQSTEDPLVFADGITNEVFEEELVGRTVTNVGRYGKVFYAELDGHERHPVMHLGMTGNMYVRGTNPDFYRSSPKKVDTQWPPRFWKFIWKMESTLTEPETELVFVDTRRLGRIRLCKDVLDEPPISMLGFDPILSFPTLEEFSSKVLKRGLPIESLLLDQTFSAGVGNWVADEILSNNFGENQVKELYDKISLKTSY